MWKWIAALAVGGVALAASRKAKAKDLWTDEPPPPRPPIPPRPAPEPQPGEELVDEGETEVGLHWRVFKFYPVKGFGAKYRSTVYGPLVYGEGNGWGDQEVPGGPFADLVHARGAAQYYAQQLEKEAGW